MPTRLPEFVDDPRRSVVWEDGVETYPHPMGLNTEVLNRPVPLCSCHTHLLSDYAAMLAQYRQPGMEFQLSLPGGVVIHRYGCRCFRMGSPPSFAAFAHAGWSVRLLNLNEADALLGYRNRRRSWPNTYRWSKSCCRDLVDAAELAVSR